MNIDSDVYFLFLFYLDMVCLRFKSIRCRLSRDYKITKSIKKFSWKSYDNGIY